MRTIRDLVAWLLHITARMVLGSGRGARILVLTLPPALVGAISGILYGLGGNILAALIDSARPESQEAMQLVGGVLIIIAGVVAMVLATTSEESNAISIRLQVGPTKREMRSTIRQLANGKFRTRLNWCMGLLLIAVVLGILCIVWVKTRPFEGSCPCLQGLTPHK
jgi:hypothetical protein